MLPQCTAKPGTYVSTQRRLSGTHGCGSLRFHRLQCDAVCAAALRTIASHWARTCRTMRGTPLPNECQRLWPNTPDWSLRVLRQADRRTPAGSAVQSSLVHSTANGFRWIPNPSEGNPQCCTAGQSATQRSVTDGKKCSVLALLRRVLRVAGFTFGSFDASGSHALTQRELPVPTLHC